MAEWNDNKISTMLHEFKDCTNETIGGLRADNLLKIKIDSIAEKNDTTENKRKKFILPWETYGSIAAVAAVLLMAVFTPLNNENDNKNANIVSLQQKNVSSDNNIFRSVPAGSTENSSDTQKLIAYDLPDNSISVAIKDSDFSNANSIWDKSISSPYALIKVNGAVYRLLQQPVSDDLINNEIAKIEEFTDNADLCNSAIFSNVVQKNEQVFDVKDMTGTAVIANVNNENRVFQRVSYYNRAVIANEKFSDIFNVKNHVIEISSDLSNITNSEDISKIMNLLFSNARFKNASPGSDSDNVIIVKLDNGINLQLTYNENTVSSCGTWECPEFIEALKNY